MIWGARTGSPTPQRSNHPGTPCPAAEASKGDLGSGNRAPASMVFPPLSMDLGLLLVSIGVVNLWRARSGG